jgi:hypothetical protein
MIDDIITHDVTDQLPQKNWVAGWRPRTTALVLHFNGPPVHEARQAGDGLIEQLKADCAWQMRAGWAGVPSGADGLQYHYVVGQDGQIWRTRHPNAWLWHCSHRVYNPQGVAIHMPVGYNEATGVYQNVSDELLASLHKIIDALQKAYSIPKERVIGHVELGTTAYCPGGPLLTWLRDYRAGKSKKPVAPVIDHPPLPSIQTYKIKRGQRSTIRQGPARSYPVVREVKGREPDAECPDRYVYVDAIKYDDQGMTIDGGKRWMHMAYVPDQQYDEGFIHETGLELVSEKELPPVDDQGIPAAVQIIGGPFMADDALIRWLDTERAHIPTGKRQSLARAYNYCSRLFGISNWLALHQADKETGGFTSERFVSYNNVAGIGATNDGARGAVFKTIEQAVFVQFLHLYHYAVREDPDQFFLALADANPRLEPLLAVHGRGAAPRWLDLHQKWAVVPKNQPVPDALDPVAYGMNIIKRARDAWSDLR